MSRRRETESPSVEERPSHRREEDGDSDVGLNKVKISVFAREVSFLRAR